MAQPAFTLPANFLSRPAANIHLEKIDFTRTSLPEYKGLYAVILDNVLTKDECDDLIRAAEARTNGEWEQAMINVGGGHQRLITDARDCGRIIWDDTEIVARIWTRIKDQVPEILSLRDQAHVTGNGPVRRGETWEFSRLNERMRFLKYTEEQYFRPHCDGSYVTPDGKEMSFYTLHLYLNELEKAAPGAWTAGGATRFHTMCWDENKYFDVDPRVGRVLVFQHRNLLHSGDDVTRGTKFTLRTDLMYKKVEQEER
ncbi:MAG: hypothetical protein L6R37_004213 [Teloschistes peruensis]|nr:MAG: hypothetical protein L6R37_004213 [Teloschistes peruensis]